MLDALGDALELNKEIMVEIINEFFEVTSIKLVLFGEIFAMLSQHPHFVCCMKHGWKP